MTPTDEQLAIIAAARDTSDNLLISALAGAAKTSTLVLIAKALPSTMMLCLAFNKRIAMEMDQRLPGNCVAQTLNSLGHKVWSQTLGRRLVLDDKKNYRLLTQVVKQLLQSEQREVYAVFSDTLKIIEQGKSAGYIPDGKFPDCTRLLSDRDFFDSLEEEPSRLQQKVVRQVTFLSMSEAFGGKIDFSDQLLMPAVFACQFPSYPLVMVDEAQDLSALNHVLLRKLAKQRLIAVGDECQAIYGFRGAHAHSMAALKEAFNMREFILSISFRCPQSIIEEARWRAPHMRWPEWATLGKVHSQLEWNHTELPESAAVICRNNAPLFRFAIYLLKNGRYPQVIGNDIGKNLLKVLKRFGEYNLPQVEVLTKIAKWEEEKLAKSRSKRAVADQADCLRVFANVGATLGEAVAYAEHLFACTGPIQLMTGHKSKGLEFDNVFILDRHLIKTEEHQQEANLLYVMQTRSKDTLTYINSKE